MEQGPRASPDKGGPGPDAAAGGQVVSGSFQGGQVGSGNVQFNNFFYDSRTQAGSGGAGHTAIPATGMPPDPAILGGTWGEGALPRAMRLAQIIFWSSAALPLAAGIIALRGGRPELSLPWGLQETFANYFYFADLFGCVMALGSGLLFYLQGLMMKSDTFTFGRETLKIRRAGASIIGIGELSIWWDSVEHITVERTPRHAEFRYSIVARFRRDREPSSALLRKYGGRKRLDGCYIVYRSGYRHHGVRFSLLNETFMKYVGHRYSDPDNPPAPEPSA